MKAVELVFAVGWAVFWLYWLIAAFSMKRATSAAWSHQLRIRVVILVAVLVLRHFGAFRVHVAHHQAWEAAVGLALFVLGLAFAVWARVNIGRNWGTPMMQRAEPELVTSGPYRLVRHPIYSGILLAGIGTAVALGWLWLIVVALAGAYFIYSARVEERYMAGEFPDSYPAYKRSSKMLLPFIL